MTSSPDRPFATLTDAVLAARIEQTRRDILSLADSRSAAGKRALSQLRRTYAELTAERDHRDWLKFDDNFPIPKIDADSTSVRDVSRGDCTLAQAVVGVGAVGNVESTTTVRGA